MKNFLSKITFNEGQSWLGIRQPTHSLTKIILGIIPIILLILFWSLLTSGKPESRVISPVILPSPTEVIKSFKTLWFNAELSRSIITSFFRVSMGFLVGLAAAFPIGILMGTFSKIRALLDPMSIFLAYLPIPALVPLTMSMFGIDEKQKIMFLALAFFIYLLPLFIKAIDEVDNCYLQTAYTMGASKWEVLRRVLFPIAFPKIITAMRLGFGIGWTYIILVEMVAAERGLGQIIMIAQRRGPREHIYLVLVIIAIIAYITDRGWVKLSRYLFPYLETK
jgi:ABC-type nitrate/sulfonate/bicarbonate transport system permease component